MVGIAVVYVIGLQTMFVHRDPSEVLPHCFYTEESPDPSEVLTVVQLSEVKVALKTGYGRYVGVNTAGELIGKSEAIGPREMWEPVFEEVGQMFSRVHVKLGCYCVTGEAGLVCM